MGQIGKTMTFAYPSCQCAGLGAYEFALSQGLSRQTFCLEREVT